MFALPAPVCYSEAMRQLGIILGLFAVAGLSVYSYTDQLLLFIMTGLVPFTQIVISPFGMILFWLFVFPLVIVSYKTIKLAFWSLISVLARAHQKHINRRARTFIPNLLPSQVCLIAISILVLNSQEPNKEIHSSKLSSRLAPLPS